MAEVRRGESLDNDVARPRRVVFMLLDQFTLMTFSAALEPLRLANHLSQRTLYDWTLASSGAPQITCSAGAIFTVDQALPEDAGRDALILVCGGLNVQRATTPALMNWLRKMARKGAAIGGLGTGAYVLARTGLLEGRRATTHWENRDGFAEDFPEVQLTRSVFVADGNRLTTAGGMASIDLMLKLIADAHGADLAATVADQLIYASIRTDQDTQRLSIPARIGVRHPKLSQVIGVMEQNIEEPISPATLASTVGMSTRQLERLFRRYLTRSPKRYYMELRLSRARNLLMQTDMSVINVALACGFASPSHFSKCYRACYQTTPYRERGAKGDGGDKG